MVPMVRRLSSLACVLALLLTTSLVGCLSSRVSLSELPAHKIAITYWEPEAARRRAEINAKASEQTRPGVAKLEELGAVVGVIDPRGGRSALERFPGHLALVDPRTGDLEVVTAAAAGAVPLVWSIDHKRLLFMSRPLRGGGNELFEYVVDSGLVSRLTSAKSVLIAGAYGPDRRLAYIAAPGPRSRGSRRLYVTEPHGVAPTLLTENGTAEALAWSPVGSPLLYTRQITRGTKSRTMIVAREPTTGSKERDLAPGRHPVFTPDGEWVVYTGPVGDRWRLSRMRPDGSGRTRIGSGRRDEFNPAVSPGSGYVAYVGGDEREIFRLYVRRMDGSGDRILLSSGGAARPVW